MITPVMACPFLTQHLTAKAVLVFCSAIAVVIFRIGTVLGYLVKPVGCCAQAHDGPSPVQIIHEVLHLILRPVLEAGEHHHEVGLGEFFDPRYVIGSWLNFAFCVNPKYHGTLKAMVFREDSGKGRQGLLRPVFVIACDEDEVLAFPEATLSIVNKRRFPKNGKYWTDDAGNSEEIDDGLHGRVIFVDGIVIRKFVFNGANALGYSSLSIMEMRIVSLKTKIKVIMMEIQNIFR